MTTATGLSEEGIMRFRMLLLGLVVLCAPAPVLAQSALTEPPEFPSSVPGPSQPHSGDPCFLLADGGVVPGDVDWLQVTIPFGSSRTVVDVDITSASGRSALLASVVGGVTQSNMADNNNAADGLCGLGAASSPVGSLFDSVGDVGATSAGTTINIGITGSGDNGFSGNHQETFTYDLWVYVVRLDPDCVMDSECVDTVACTVDRCNPNNGTCEHTADHGLCDDGQYCNGRERCNATNGCFNGAAPCPPDLQCNEQNDSCVDCLGDADCDDGVFCNGAEWCGDGICEEGSPEFCDDGVECTFDLCDGEADECMHVVDDRSCDDGVFCNGAERCDAALGCQTGSPACDDGVDCTEDGCDESTDTCTSQPNDSRCGNGIFCDGVETCDPTAGCRSSEPPCDDHVACTLDSCDEGNDTCKHRPDNNKCDDGIDCTVDRCDTGDGSCHHFPVDAKCDDGRFCNGEETCDVSVGCQAGENPCQTAVRCNERRDVCVNCYSDAQCNDGKFCNGKEVCVQGVCQAGKPPKCDDGVECSVDQCNAETNRCEHLLNHRSCDDGNFCNGRETCHPRKDCEPGRRRCRGGAALSGSN